MAHDAVAGVLPLLQEDRENWRQAPRRTPRSSCSRWISCEEEYGAVISLGAGAVSFTHIVVTSEPVVSAIMIGLFLKTYDSPQTYLSLLPIVGGVALVSLKELSFVHFAVAMLSNVSPRSKWARRRART